MNRLWAAFIMLLWAWSAMSLDCVFSKISTSDGLSDNQVQHILQLDDGRIAVTTNGNINIYDGSRFLYVHYNPSTEYPLPDYTGAYHVYVGDDDLVWIKDWGRVQCFDLKQDSYVENLDSIFALSGAGSMKPSDLFIDSDRGLWLVDDKGVLDASSRRRFVPALAGRSLQDLEVSGDSLLLFYSDGVMEVFDRSNGKSVGKIQSYPDKESFTGSSLVVKGDDGYIYQIRTGFGNGSILQRYSHMTHRWEELLRVPYVLHTLNMGSNGYSYVTSSNGLWRINLDAPGCEIIPEIKTTEGIIPTSGFNTMFIDNQGGFWIGTYFDGMLYGHESRMMMRSAISPEELGLSAPEPVKCDNGAYSGDYKGRVNCWLKDSHGFVWLGTPDGLKILDGDKLKVSLFAEDGLTNNNIKAMAEDERGVVWIATGAGISSVSLTDSVFAVHGYGRERGTLDDEYDVNGVYKLADGRILFSSKSGYTLVTPQDDFVAGLHLKPLFLNIKVNGEPVHGGSKSRLHSLSFRENDISFDIASLNYPVPERTRFGVKLISGNVHNDKDWTILRSESGDGVLHMSFASLQPGDYIVKVKVAADDLSGWGEVSELRFRINPPWWLSDYAKISYIILAAVLICVACIVYRRIEQKRLQRRHNEEKLLMRVTDLIERCNYYEEMMKPETAPSGDDESVNHLSDDDRQFIDKAISLVEANLGTRGYSVEQLGKDLCMERTGLYKRMTQLLDKSPSAFIKSIRLNHAARLVVEGRLSVAEIAELTGFSSSSYMSKCFVDTWGCTPLEYARKNRDITDNQ